MENSINLFDAAKVCINFKNVNCFFFFCPPRFTQILKCSFNQRFVCGSLGEDFFL